MTTDVKLRPAGPDDLSAMHDLLAVLHGGAPPWGKAREEQARAVFNRMIEDPARRVVLAFDDETPVGTIDVIVIEGLTRDASPWAVIENVVVAEHARRRGIGRRLISAAIAFAEEHGCYKVQLVSPTRRAEAQLVYKALGFDADVQGYRRYLRAVS